MNALDVAIARARLVPHARPATPIVSRELCRRVMGPVSIGTRRVTFAWGAPVIHDDIRPVIFLGVASRHRAKVQELADLYDVTSNEIFSNRRNHIACLARHHLMWWIKESTGWSLPRIGRFVGGRDHTTVLHGVRRHQARIDAGEVAADAGLIEGRPI